MLCYLDACERNTMSEFIIKNRPLNCMVLHETIPAHFPFKMVVFNQENLVFKIAFVQEVTMCVFVYVCPLAKYN